MALGRSPTVEMAEGRVCDNSHGERWGVCRRGTCFRSVTTRFVERSDVVCPWKGEGKGLTEISSFTKNNYISIYLFSVLSIRDLQLFTEGYIS